MARYRIGLALGGGAARGWAHIGVIETLLEAGIKPDVIAGTSMGALVGGAFAAGRFADLKDWALRADQDAVANLIDIDLLHGGLIGGEKIRRLLSGMGLSVAIEDLPMPFATVATDLRDGREIWLQKGLLDEAIGASIAMPGIFSPRRLEERWLVDGGLVNRVPVSVCRALGADYVIAVNVAEGLISRYAPRPSPPSAIQTLLGDLVAQMPEPLCSQLANLLPQAPSAGEMPPGYFSVLAIALNVMQEKITRSRLAGEPPHAMIAPKVAEMHLLDFDMAGIAIEAGRKATADALDAIRTGLAV